MNKVPDKIKNNWEAYSPAEREILNLFEKEITVKNSEFIEEIILSAFRLLHDHADRGEIKLINSAVKELRYALKVFAPYRQIRKVTIFGSARAPENSPDYKQAVKFARTMVKKGFMVITGAASGIMEAGNLGAGKEKSFGVNIRLPFEQRANKIIEGDPKLINFRYFFTRKLIFVKETDAVVLFPGGFGTLDEGFELLTLVQTGKSNPIPIICLEEPGGTYWKGWEHFIHTHMLKKNMIGPDDLSLFKITDSLAEATKEILNFYKNYHSMRFVGQKLVIRMLHGISKKKLDEINRNFLDILASGEFVESPALPEEHEELELRSHPRLIFHFKKDNFGRLRQLINEINNS